MAGLLESGQRASPGVGFAEEVGDGDGAGGGGQDAQQVALFRGAGQFGDDAVGLLDRKQQAGAGGAAGGELQLGPAAQAAGFGQPRQAPTGDGLAQGGGDLGRGHGSPRLQQRQGAALAGVGLDGRGHFRRIDIARDVVDGDVAGDVGGQQALDARRQRRAESAGEPAREFQGPPVEEGRVPDYVKYRLGVFDR